jgi:transcriptional regulator with XRE-family HTH domain
VKQRAYDEHTVFRALLQHHRGSRGMSQLDLAIAADVSSRHISFLETGRARPSRDMVLRLGVALGLCLRDVNALLHAVGLSPAFPESAADAPLAPAIERALERMLAHQEPFPMVIMSHRYDVLRMNHAASAVLLRFVEDPSTLGEPLNAMHAIFHPHLLRPFIADWPAVARAVLARLQRDALGRPGDGAIPELMRALCAYPGVPADWRTPAFDAAPSPTFDVTLERDDERARFLTTLTVFNAPLDVTLEELRIESYFPLDAATEQLCERLSPG